jgi:hypothetical protein
MVRVGTCFSSFLLCQSFLFLFSLSLVPFNDRKSLQDRTISFDHDDESVSSEAGEDGLRTKRPKSLSRGKEGTFLSISLLISLPPIAS